MRNFDGKDMGNWILQMEKYFDLHGVPLLQKVCIASNYLEPNQFLWYKGHCSCKPLVTWSIFTEEMIAHYEDTKRNTFFSQLINLKQKFSMEEHIEDFQKFNIRENDIPEKQRIDVSIGTLKDDIQHEVCLWEPDSLEKAFRITTPQTIKIEGHIKKKNVQEVKDHIEHQEMNPTVCCKALEEITTPQTLKIEGHIKNKKV
eukprot:PITA_29910